MTATPRHLDFTDSFDYRKFPEIVKALKDTEAQDAIQASAREHGIAQSALSVLTIPEPDWAIKGWLATGLNGLLAGAPKTFKSTLMLDMATSLATGAPFLGLYPVLNRPAPVIYIQEENTIQDMRQHTINLFTRMGFGTPYKMSYPDDRGIGRLHTVFVPGDVAPKHEVTVFPRRGWKVEAEDLNWLVERIEHLGAEWVFIDPLYKITPPGMTLNNDETISKMTYAMDRVSEATGANIIIVHHTNKSKGATGGEKVMGSNLIWGWAGQTMWVDRGAELDNYREEEDEDGPRTYHRIKVEHDFRSMAPVRPFTWLEYSGDAQWSEMNKSPVGRPAASGKVAAMNRMLEDPDFDTASYAKEFEVTPRTIRNWKAEAFSKVEDL